jgi:hypothetical protein
MSTRATSMPKAGMMLTQAALSCTERSWALKLRAPSGMTQLDVGLGAVVAGGSGVGGQHAFQHLLG